MKQTYNGPQPGGGPYPDLTFKFYLRRIHLNREGYTPNGRYFGVGRPLYNFFNVDGTIDDEIRADNREHAKERIQAKYTSARFYQ